MRTRPRAGLVGGVRLLLAGSLMLGAMVVSASTLRVDVEDGRISIDAADASLDDLVEAVASRAGLRLIQRVSLSSQVDYSAENAPLAEVLAELLEPVSYLLFLPATTDDEGIPGTLWIFAEGTIESLAAQEFADAILLHGTVAEKKSTIIELGRRGSLADVQSLSLALGDEDARVRHAALAALSGIGGDDALAAIASAARSGDADMSADAANALGVAGGRSAASYLDIALADDDPRIRAAAVEAFGELGDAAARGRIQAALDDPDAEVRQRAVEALEELDDEALYRALFPGATGMR